MAAALVAFTVSAIDALKTYVLKGWASRVPAVVWYLLAIGIPTGVCVWLGLDWFSAVTGEQIPAELEPYASAATGVIVGIGASGSYKAKEIAKALKAESLKAEGKAVPEYLTPVGEPGIPAPVDVQPEITQETYVKPEQTSTVNPDGHDKPTDVIVVVSANAPVSQTGNTPETVNTPQLARGQTCNQPVSEITQDTEQSTSRLSDQTPNVPTVDAKDVSGDNSQIGNRNTQNGNEQNLPHLDTSDESSITSTPSTRPADVSTRDADSYTYVEESSTYPAYLMRFVEVNTPLVVLSPEGKLYRVYNGQVKELPKGWNV
jgi:hypothetical protein